MKRSAELNLPELLYQTTDLDYSAQSHLHEDIVLLPWNEKRSRILAVMYLREPQQADQDK